MSTSSFGGKRRRNKRYQSINNRTIPMHSEDGSTIGSKGFSLLQSSTSSSRRLCSKKGSRSSKFLMSTPRTLPGSFDVFLRLSKTVPIHDVIGTRQSCMPRKLPRKNHLRTLSLLSMYTIICFYFFNIQYLVHLQYIFYLGYLRSLIWSRTTLQYCTEPLLQFFCCQTLASLWQKLKDTFPIFLEYCHDESTDDAKVDLVQRIFHQELMDTTVQH